MFRLLGPLEVEVGGHPVHLGGPKPRALLAILALDVGRVVSVDRLVEDLWPEQAPLTAPHAVQVYVSQLRKILPESIARRGLGYVLEVPPDAVDVHTFARLVVGGHEALRAEAYAVAADTLRDALALWRGPALADFAYEPFAQAEIARLEEQRFVALEDRIEADLALGRHGELVTEIEALVEAQPLRERPRALLMRALYLAGRQADALAAYRSTREKLVEDLGIEPGPELRELESAILRQDASLAPVSAPDPVRIRTRRLAAVLSVGLGAVDGVDAEVEDRRLESLAAAVSSVASRHGGVTERLADGSVVALFGVPVAHEDDPLRAAHAAVETRQALTTADVGPFTAAIDVGEVVASERSASGSPVRTAARLRQDAPAGDILVSLAAARRISHAARLEPRGEASALIELEAEAHAFDRRLDTPLVGRKEELATLRNALKLARREHTLQAVLVVGPAGIGKSRLVDELRRRVRGVRVISGRCLSYGDGITYWPVHEMLGQAPGSARRDAVRAALATESPPPAGEIALLFREFCEELAEGKPLLVVFDDLHWAEPTLLQLVDHVVARGAGPIVVLGLGREELVEEGHATIDAHPNAKRLLLGGLPSDETETLLLALDGSILDAEQRARIVQAADGNPFFLEQLVALAREGALAADSLPETVRAVLSARLDRLGPGERAVLERGAIVGREFTADDVTALLEPAAVPTVGPHLDALCSRGFTLERGGGAYAFRHVLLQEATTRSAPKRLRAGLHERFADRLDDAYSNLPDLDEFVGFHLEQAYRLRRDLGESGRQTATLAEHAGQRLGEAGFRALKRGDMPATVSLLTRATDLLPQGHERRLDLLSELGVAQFSEGDAGTARTTFSTAIADSVEAAERRPELRARIERAYLDLITDPDGAADALLTVVDAAVPTLETFGDARTLARAWVLAGYVRGGIHGNHAAWVEAEERALVYYRQTPFPPATPLGQIAAALYWGPTPVPQAIDRCEELLGEDIGYTGSAAVLPYLGGLYAQRGDFARGEELLAEAGDIYSELGNAASVMVHCGTVVADVEVLRGDDAAAERALRKQCEFFEHAGDRSHLGVRAAKLADVLLRLERLEEAEHWAHVSRSVAAEDDLSAQLVLRSVEAMLLARRGAYSEARALAEDNVRGAGDTDALNRVAEATVALADVLLLAGHNDEARDVLEQATRIYERKGNTSGRSRAARLLAEVSPT